MGSTGRPVGPVDGKDNRLIGGVIDKAMKLGQNLENKNPKMIGEMPGDDSIRGRRIPQSSSKQVPVVPAGEQD